MEAGNINLFVVGGGHVVLIPIEAFFFHIYFISFDAFHLLFLLS